MNSEQTGAAEAADHDVVVATFQDLPAAEAARAALVAAGIAADAVEIVTEPAHAHTESRAAGIWARVADTFIPGHHHAHVYAEAVHRGRAVLFVRAETAQHTAMAVLETCHPVDITQHVEAWHGDGWSGVHGGASAAELPHLHFAQASEPDHVRFTGLINEDETAPEIGRLVNPMGIEVPGIRRSGNARVVRYETI